MEKEVSLKYSRLGVQKKVSCSFFSSLTWGKERKQRIRFKEISPFYLKAPISALRWPRNETAILMVVYISLRSRMKNLHFLQKQKHHHSVPQGTSEELKKELTVHLETFLLKIICLAHCSMKTVSETPA